jgi:hypothetical protein
VLDRVRVGQRAASRRASTILPRSNPFSIPGPRLIDSLVPAVRFLTLVVLFTAAGIWIQMKGHRAGAAADKMELPKTAAQPPAIPAKNAADRTAPAPTATGPLETKPQTEARVGQIEGNDFAQRETRAIPAQLDNRPALSPPHFLVRSSGPLPRVQNSEPLGAGVGDDSARGDDPARQGDPARGDGEEAPSMAQLPGFFIEIPTR